MQKSQNEESVIAFEASDYDPVKGERQPQFDEMGTATQFADALDLSTLEIRMEDFDQAVVPFSEYQPQYEPPPSQNGKEDTPKVTVCEPKLLKNALGSHVVYQIYIKYNYVTFETQRRYKEFAALQQRLATAWTGCYVPQLPPKKKMGNKKSKFIETRCMLLESFFKQCVAIPYLYESPIMKLFLQQNKNFHQAKFQQESIQSIQTRFLQYFEEFQQKKLTELTVESIELDQDNFRKLHGFFKQLEPQIEQSVWVYTQFKQNLNQMNNFMVDFETTYGETYQTGQNFQPIDRPWENQYYILLDWIREEQLDLSAILQTFQGISVLKAQLKDLERQLSKENEIYKKAKEFKKTLFKRKPPNEKVVQKLEANLQELNKDVERLEQIIHIVTVRLCEHELPRFKQWKSQSYKRARLEFGACSISEFNNIIDLCNAI